MMISVLAVLSCYRPRILRTSGTFCLVIVLCIFASSPWIKLDGACVRITPFDGENMITGYLDFKCFSMQGSSLDMHQENLS